MSYFDRGYHEPRRPSYIFYIVLALVSAVIGGLVVMALGPSWLAQRVPPQLAPDQRQGADQRSLPPLPGVDPADSPVVAIAERVGPAVVGITSFTGRGTFSRAEVASGSGVVIDSKNGYIATNYHVVEGAREIQVILDEKRFSKATLVGADPETDLAVLQTEVADLPQAALGDSADLRVGEMAVAIGNPLGREFARTVTVGVISALDREISVESRAGGEVTLRVIQTDAAINPGNSGGALVNARGEVIGINSVKIAKAGVEGMGFAIPISDARPIIEQLIRQGYVKRPFIGIFNFSDVSPEEAEWYKLPVGLYVGGVVPGGPAAKAGMRPEDVIVAIDNQSIETFNDLQTILAKYQVGDQVKITVVRDGKRLNLSITLGEKPRR
ncbi:hypothetical protein SY88_09365 [Clostridiales bacterium PH28_bin88]|nr:hypothetical protein SY88_09365 [Clostridiales bacterium PH28_bin88]